jgi:uncharacterized protein (TIGR03435 family)
MRNAGIGLLAACALALGTSLLQAVARGDGETPSFEHISIQRTAIGPPVVSPMTLPDGSLRMAGVTAAQLLSRAYPLDEYDIVGAPDWSRTERYDVRTTSVVSNPTADERQAMVRALLADRFGLQVRVEPRETDAYDMVVARDDGRLGPRIEASDIDCAAVKEPWWLGGYPPQERGSPRRRACIPWHHPDLLEGTLTMAELAGWLPEFVGRPVVDKTGLAGYYMVTVRLSRRRPAIDTIRDDLGLELVPSRLVRQMVIVERFNPPTGVEMSP